MDILHTDWGNRFLPPSVVIETARLQVCGRLNGGGHASEVSCICTLSIAVRYRCSCLLCNQRLLLLVVFVVVVATAAVAGVGFRRLTCILRAIFLTLHRQSGLLLQLCGVRSRARFKLEDYRAMLLGRR